MTAADIDIFSVLDTPSYVFDLDLLNTRSETIASHLPENVSLNFALKANPFLVGRLGLHISGYEVCSTGELNICRKMHIDGANIVFSSVNKTISDISCAFEYNVGTFTAESRKQLELINDYAQLYDKKCRVLLRLSSGNQFGMDRNTIESILSTTERYEKIDFIGIHYFTATQRIKPTEQIAEITMLNDWFGLLRDRYRFEPRHLEYGPGLGVSYFDDSNSDITEVRLLDELYTSLKDMSEYCSVTVELGRYIAAHCGKYITSIDDIKHADGVNYVVVDGGIHHLTYAGQIWGMQIPYFTHIHTEQPELCNNEYMICGSLCTTNDILMRKVKLTDPKVGDRLVFHNTGAYSVTEGISLFLSRPLPKIYVKDHKNGLVLLRDVIETHKINSSVQSQDI